MQTSVSRQSLWLAAIAAALSALQPWTLMILGEVNVSSMAALSADPESGKRTFIALLAFMPCMFIAYWLAARSVAMHMPVAASFAMYAFGLWFALELLPRSFDLWVVHGRWLDEYTTSPAMREEIEQRYVIYRDVVHALAFVRRHALLVGQLCLAVAVWKSGMIGRLLAIALIASIVRLLLGTLATYAGMDGLDALADALYYVTVTTVFPLLALWLCKLTK